MLVEMSMTLKLQKEGSRHGICAITKMVRGILPSTGTHFIFQMPLAAEDGCIWMNGCIMGIVTRITCIEERGKVIRYHVDLRAIAISFHQFQQVAQASWLERTGWRVTEEALESCAR